VESRLALMERASGPALASRTPTARAGE